MRHRRTWLILVLAFIVLAECAITLSGMVDMSAWVPRTVDIVRDMVGPEPVAAAEDIYYQVQDLMDRTSYNLSHRSSSVPATSEAVATAAPTITIGSSEYADRTPAKPITPTPAPSAIPTASARVDCPRSLKPIVLVDPQVDEGVWTARDMPLANRLYPPLCRTFVRPDPERPYARVDLVSIDLTQTKLNIVAGMTEPKPEDGIPGPGQIPPSVQTSGKLVAAWNGGFLTVHGAFGMMVDKRIILPPKDGLATLAQYSDGRIRLGEWGRAITMTADLVTFRQNGPMLVNQGEVKGSDYWTWGKSVSGSTFIWRSGLGMTPDGRLIFAMGNPLSAKTLGDALRQAGVSEAMQLDVNAGHVFFFTYDLKDSSLVATKLNRDFAGSTQTFLKPHDRDFMYLTVK